MDQQDETEKEIIIDLPTLYGQVVVGPPGCGKTTFCNGMQQYLNLLGRNALVINLDPANEFPSSLDGDDEDENDDNGDNDSDGNEKTKKDNDDDDNDDNNSNNSNSKRKPPYDMLLDICQDVVNLNKVMKQLNLGPNGGLLYCMEYIQTHSNEIINMIKKRIIGKQYQTNNNSQQQPPPYIIFDLPGQIELYTHNNSVHEFFIELQKVLDIRLTMVQLIDSHYCMDGYKFISVALLSLTCMIKLELPSINILSKIDLLYSSNNNNNTATIPGSNDDDDDDSYYGNDEGFGGGNSNSYLPFNIDYFTQCYDLHRLIPYLDGNNYYNDNYGDRDFNNIMENDTDYQNALHKVNNSNFVKKHKKLHENIAEIIDDYSLLNFIPCDINNAESVGRIVNRIDKANGYIYIKRNTSNSHSNSNHATSQQQQQQQQQQEDLFQCAIQSDTSTYNESLMDIQEKLIGSETISELRTSSSSKVKKKSKKANKKKG